MAIRTLILAAFADHACRMELDYDDVDLRARAFRCVNDTDLPAAGYLARADGSVRREATFPANQTTEIAIPTGQAQRIQLTPTGPVGAGRFAGHTAGFSYPA